MTVRIVGRDPELRQFAAARDRVRSARSASFIVEGEPGIGKTRLLEELRTHALQDEWNVIEWRCSELDVDRPFVAAFSGLDALVEDLAKISDSLPSELEEARRLWRASVGGWFSLDQPNDGRPGESAPNGDGIVQLVIDGLLDLLRTRPLLLLVDDAQWIDNASSRILWGLAGRRRSVALLTVVTFRPDRRDEVRMLRRGLESQGATNVILGALSDKDGEALVAELVGLETTEAIRSRHQFALRESRGNPLFVIELLRFDEYPMEETGLASILEIPNSLRALITRRFDALPAETKACLQKAAALGSVFDVNELAVVEGRSLSHVFDILGPAIDLRMLVYRHGQLSLQHSIVHRIVQDLQPLALRSALHLELARSLGAANWSATRVGEHFFLSNTGPSDEVSKWLRAASLEVRALSLEAALAWSQRALACSTAEGRFETQLDVAGLLVLLGRLDDAEALCTKIRQRTMTIDEEVRFRLSYSALISMTGRTRDTEAMENFEWVRSNLEPGDGRHVELLGWKAILLVFRGQLDESEQIAKAALELKVSGDASRVASGPLEALGLIAMLRGDTADALRYSRESAEAYRNHRNVYSSVMVPHFALGMAMFSSCSINDVIATLQQGLDLCDLAGHGLARSHLEPITAIAYLAAGQLEIGRSIIESAVHRNSNWRDTKVTLPTGSGLAALVALLADDLTAAKMFAQRSFDELLEGGAQAGSADFAFWCIANVSEEAGDGAKARELLVGVWEMLPRMRASISSLPILFV